MPSHLTMPSLSLGPVLLVLCCVLAASASPLVHKPQVSFPVECALPPSYFSSFYLLLNPPQLLRRRRVPAHVRRRLRLPQGPEPTLRRCSLLRERWPPRSQLRSDRAQRPRRRHGTGALHTAHAHAPPPCTDAHAHAGGRLHVPLPPVRPCCRPSPVIGQLLGGKRRERHAFVA